MQNMDQATTQQSEADSAISSQKSTEPKVKRNKITELFWLRKNDEIKHCESLFYR